MNNPLPEKIYVREISHDTGFSESFVAALYEHEFKAMAATAAIQAYVPLLVTKRVRQHLRRLPAGAKSVL